MAATFPVEHLAICSTLYQYATGVDTRNWSLYRSIFEDEVEIDMSSFNGTAGRLLAADAWVGQVADLMHTLDATQHFMASPLVEVGGDEAVCTMYVQAEHVVGDRWYTLGGYYRDRLMRHSDAWRIAAVNLTVQWKRGDPEVLSGGAPRR